MLLSHSDCEKFASPFVVEFAWSSFRPLVHATGRHTGATGLAGSLDIVVVLNHFQT